jgi:hypothetical protein
VASSEVRSTAGKAAAFATNSARIDTTFRALAKRHVISLGDIDMHDVVGPRTYGTLYLNRSEVAMAAMGNINVEEAHGAGFDVSAGGDLRFGSLKAGGGVHIEADNVAGSIETIEGWVEASTSGLPARCPVT